MAENVVPFQNLTPASALELIRRLGERSGRIGLPAHVQKRMRQREVSWMQIRHAIRHGVPSEGPYQDVRGDWLCTLDTRAAGRNVSVVVKMVSQKKLVVLTAKT